MGIAFLIAIEEHLSDFCPVFPIPLEFRMRCYLILYNCHSCYLPFYFNLMDLLHFEEKKKREREISFPDESPSLLPATLLLSFLGGFFGRWDQGLSHLASICPMHLRFC